MLLTDCFFLDIKRINIAHEFTINRIHGCEYPRGRGHYGLVCVKVGKAEYRFFTCSKIYDNDSKCFRNWKHVACSLWGCWRYFPCHIKFNAGFR